MTIKFCTDGYNSEPGFSATYSVVDGFHLDEPEESVNGSDASKGPTRESHSTIQGFCTFCCSYLFHLLFCNEF